MEKDILKPVRWMGLSYDNWKAFPEEVQDILGYALYQAQAGNAAVNTKPLKGFKGASVLEIRADFDSNTWRAVYTVRFKDVIYVLHAFQKKSRKGISVPKADIKLIEKRLKQAREDYEANKA